jgi:hypothetical protein
MPEVHATGEAKYMDLIELTILNAVRDGASLNGTDWSYVNPLRVLDPMPTPLETRAAALCQQLLLPAECRAHAGAAPAPTDGFEESARAAHSSLRAGKPREIRNDGLAAARSITAETRAGGQFMARGVFRRVNQPAASP